MSDGRIYTWALHPDNPFEGHVTVSMAPLPRLDAQGEGKGRLWGRYVRVRNGGSVTVLDPATGTAQSVALGNAQPNAEGNFLFEPGRGGGCMDNIVLAEPGFLWRIMPPQKGTVSATEYDATGAGCLSKEGTTACPAAALISLSMSRSLPLGRSIWAQVDY